MVYRFGEFEVRTESGEVFRNGTRLRVQEQSLQILLALLDSPGAVVSRDQLRERLWPEGIYVDFDHSLNAAVKRLRAALEDDADKPRYIETLPRRGYRLVAPVTHPGGEEELSAVTVAEPVKESQSGPRWLRAVGFTAAILAVTASVLWVQGRYRPTGAYGLNRLIGASGGRRSSEAYELYLRSLTYRAEPPDNAQAMKLLERATELDPASSRLWFELARRYRVEYVNAGRGQGYFQQAREANRRALEIDPEFWPARVQQVTLELEGGEVVEGYRLALGLTRARPQNGPAHYALSYALRYGGLYEESASECELALRLDPTNSAFRSCSLVYILLGRYDRASAYLDLDPLSTYVRYRRTELGILMDKRGTALEMARSIRVGPHDYPDARLIESVLSGAPVETVENWSQETEALSDRINLPESYFVEARYLAWSGHTEAAFRLLRRAIANNYCSYPLIDSDPFVASIRHLPSYSELRRAGIACRESFRAQIQKVP